MTMKGVVTAIGTPLSRDEIVDEPGLRRLIQYVLSANVDGILVNGSMGGFAFLTDQEQLRAISIVTSEVNGRIPVIGGLGETGTKRAVHKAKQFAQEGIDYLSLLPPFYFMTAQTQLVTYFSEIAAAVDVPLILYDNPLLTKVHIEPNTVVELRGKIPNLAGIKVSNSDSNNLQTLLSLLKNDPTFFILTGSESLFLVGLQMGCQGGVGGLYSVCPHLAVEMYRAFSSGNLERAREIQQQLIEIWQLFRFGDVWGGFDEALRYLGICESATGSPYSTRVTEKDKEQVQSILKRYLRPVFAPVR